MGNRFSGWHGRRSHRPYFDELLRVAIADIPAVNSDAWFYIGGCAVRLVRVKHGWGHGTRLICAKCRKTCRVVYLSTALCCYRCTDARYRSQSEAPGRRAVRRAERVMGRLQVDLSRPAYKAKWLRWPKYLRMSAEAEKAGELVADAGIAPSDALRLLAGIKRRTRGSQPDSG